MCELCDIWWARCALGATIELMALVNKRVISSREKAIVAQGHTKKYKIFKKEIFAWPKNLCSALTRANVFSSASGVQNF